MSRMLGLSEYLMMDLFFSGGFLFWVMECIYILIFNYSIRMKSKSTHSFDKNEDHENPQVVARNKRMPHSPLRSFSSVYSYSFYLDL